jgi:hypothetical protein
MGLGRQQGFSGDAVQTTLTGAIDDSQLTFPVASVSGFPSSGLPFTLTLDQGNPTLQETVLVDSYSGLTVTVDTLVGRGYDRTAAQAHAEDAPVVHTLDAAFCADVSARLFSVSTKGDIPIVEATTDVVMGRLPISATEFQVVGAGAAGLPAYQDSAKSKLTTLGDLLYASAANVLARLGIGTNGQVLTVVGGVPAWGLPPGLQPIDKSASYVAASSDFAVCSASLTVTSPAPAKGVSFGAVAAYAATNAAPVGISVSSGVIYGPGVAAGATTLTLGAKGAFVVLTSDGTNWFVTSGAQDTGWTTPPLLNTWTAGIVYMRLVGNRVSIRGNFDTPGTSNTIVFDIPSAMNPPAEIVVPIAFWAGGIVPVYAVFESECVIVYGGSPAAIFLDGITYLVD